jgi:glucokinase
MDLSSYPRLVGDIGGTNARFAWKSGPAEPLADVASYPCAGHPSLQHAMQHYLAAHGKPAARWCAIGIANPIVGDRVQMTNHHWSFSISEVKAALGFDRFLVLNDFTALALSLPALPASDLRQVGGAAPVPDAPLALIGPGTGLGVSGLLPARSGRGAIPINGEGGHVTLAATDALEESVVRLLRRQFGHASAERALSGPGLVSLYGALCELDGVVARPLQAAEITTLALSGQDRQCGSAVDVFFSLLGTVAGNLALSLGARGGLYIGGGIVPRLGERIDQSSFRRRFEEKGRFRSYLAQIPVFVVQAKTSPALLGAAQALEDI